MPWVASQESWVPLIWLSLNKFKIWPRLGFKHLAFGVTVAMKDSKRHWPMYNVPEYGLMSYSQKPFGFNYNSLIILRCRCQFSLKIYFYIWLRLNIDEKRRPMDKSEDETTQFTKTYMESIIIRSQVLSTRHMKYFVGQTVSKIKDIVKFYINNYCHTRCFFFSIISM